MDKLHFSDETVNEVIKNEDPYHYIINMIDGRILRTDIDSICEHLKEQGKIKKVTIGHKMIGGERVKHYYEYNGDAYGYMLQVSTKITNEDVYYLLNSGLVDYTVVEPIPEDVEPERCIHSYEMTVAGYLRCVFCLHISQ